MTLSKLLQNLGIQAVLFDLDDTLLCTRDVFVKAVDRVIAHLADKTELDHDELQGKFNEINAKAYKVHVVNPDTRWPCVLEELAKVYPEVLPETETCLSFLWEIYEEVPELYDGALELLQALTEAKVKIGLVTHAREEWTDFKLKSTGLLPYFNHVEIEDVNVLKGLNVWQKAMTALGVEPANTVVIGDNLKGDVIAPVELGVKHALWLKHPEAWSVYQEGEVPEGAIVIEALTDFTSTLEALGKRTLSSE